MSPAETCALYRTVKNRSLTCAASAGVMNRTFLNLIWLYLVSNIRFKT